MRNIFVLLLGAFVIVWAQQASAQCLRLNQDTNALTLPQNKPYFYNKGELFKIIKKSANGKRILALGNGVKVVLPSNKVTEESCSETAVYGDRSHLGFFKRTRIGLEYQMIMNASEKDYKGLITYVPDATDVSALQDPIISKIDKGTGYMIRLTADYELSDNIDLDAHVGMRKLTYKFTQLSNPEVTVTPLSSLAATDKTFDLTHYAFGAGGKYFFWNMPKSGLRFFVGGQAQLLYSTASSIVVNAFTGTTFKNTPTTISVKTDQLTYDGLAHIGVRWSFLNFSVGITPNMAYAINLGGGYKF